MTTTIKVFIVDDSAVNVAQDKETCVVYGMPKEAAALGAASEVVRLEGFRELSSSG